MRTKRLPERLAKLRECLERYNNDARHPSWDRFDLSELEDLEDIWRENRYWPSAKNAGVYLLFADDFSLLYVGKASASSTIGSRLSSYFRTMENGMYATHEKDRWTAKPRYVAAIPVAKPWHAPSLEEFLISELGPPDNRNLKA